jgi:hypothetical protein
MSTAPKEIFDNQAAGGGASTPGLPIAPLLQEARADLEKYRFDKRVPIEVVLAQGALYAFYKARSDAGQTHLTEADGPERDSLRDTLISALIAEAEARFGPIATAHRNNHDTGVFVHQKP